MRLSLISDSVILLTLLLLSLSACTLKEGRMMASNGSVPAALALNEYQQAVRDYQEQLSDRTYRHSPAECHPEHGDVCESFADAIAPEQNDRISLVIQKPRLTPDLPVIVVEDANGDGRLEELGAALQTLKGTNGGRRVRIVKGVYELPHRPECATRDSLLCLVNTSDVEIDGGGSDLTFESPYHMALTINQSSRIVVKNLNFKRRYRNAYKGKVVMTSLGMGIQITDSEAPATVPNWEFDSVLGYDPIRKTAHLRDGRQHRRLNYDYDTESQRFPQVMDAANRIFYDDRVGKHPEAYPLGSNVLILRNRRAPDPSLPGETRARAGTIRAMGRETNDISFVNVAVHSATQSAFNVTYAGRGFHFKNVQVVPETGGPSELATRGGGIIVVGSEGDILIEGEKSPELCEQETTPSGRCLMFKRLGDDAINVEGMTLSVTNARFDDDTNELIAHFQYDETSLTGGLNVPYRLANVREEGEDRPIGDRFAFVIDKQFAKGYAEVVSTHYVEAEKKLIVRFSAVDGTNLRRLATLINQANRSPIALNLSAGSSRLLVRKASIDGTAGRGLILHSPNARVEHNRIAEAVHSGIQARFTFNSAFVEGPGASNVVIAKNWMSHTNLDNWSSQWRGAISVGTEGVDENGNWFPLVNRILIQNNQMAYYRGVAIQTTATRAVTIVGNQISNPWPMANYPTAMPRFLRPIGDIFLDRTWRVEIDRNRCPNLRECSLVNGVILGVQTGNITFP